MVSEEFGEGRLLAGRVEFDQLGQELCGIRQTKSSKGLAHLDLYFGENTSKERCDLFTLFIEEHLRLNGVDIREYQGVKCECGEIIPERIVQENIQRGQYDVICPVCRKKTLISDNVARIRKRDPKSDYKMLALRKTIEDKTATDAAMIKSNIAGKKRVDVWKNRLEFLQHKLANTYDESQKSCIQLQISECSKQIISLMNTETTPVQSDSKRIRLLHLSDLHFTRDTSPISHLVPLLQDIRKGEYLGFDSVEYLVISGDITDRGNNEGFDKAREFVEQLIAELGLSAQRCIFAPGNHDLQDLKESYIWQDSVEKGLNNDLWVCKGDIYLVRDESKYQLRLKKFSDAFFHKIVPAQPYPLDPVSQGQAFFFDETRIQFLVLNSAWQIDQFYRKRSGLHSDATANAIALADKQISDAIARKAMNKGQKILRIGVWHHSLQHPEMMQKADPVELLREVGVRFCLHGDVHENNRDLFKYWRKKKMDIIGAGSFGAISTSRPDSVPRLYNLLEITPDLSFVRVHTRRRSKPDGPWEGWFEWDNPDGNGRLPYYDVSLT